MDAYTSYMNTEYFYLNQLIGTYFNQDADMWGDSIEEILNCFIATDDNVYFIGLNNDIDKFLQQNDKAIEGNFLKRYEWDFDPNLWGMTVKAFLTFVRQQIVTRLEEHHSL